MPARKSFSRRMGAKYPTPDLPPLVVMIVTPGKSPRYIQLPDPRVAFIREFNSFAVDDADAYARLDPFDQDREDKRLAGAMPLDESIASIEATCRQMDALVACDRRKGVRHG